MALNNGGPTDIFPLWGSRPLYVSFDTGHNMRKRKMKLSTFFSDKLSNDRKWGFTRTQKAFDIDK